MIKMNLNAQTGNALTTGTDAMVKLTVLMTVMSIAVVGIF